ncbi:MAG TPA: alpha/beta hydrolase fold domain-containing protein [Tepidisphaeraceae bacterium]|nr:alpha/beta hydrolase fold domain-containing protein [Tepidisphaeraceae bacterium]
MRSACWAMVVVGQMAGLVVGQTMREIEVARHGEQGLRMDVVLPEGDGPFPVVVYVHGGGGVSGDRKQDLSELGPALTRGGLAYVSVSYRFAPDHRWPACLEDVCTAVRYVRDHAAALRVDANRLAIMGYSAGGQLAFMAALTGEDLPPIRAIVGLAPPTDFEQDLAARGGLSRSLQALLDRSVEPDETSIALLRQIGPVHHIRADMPAVLIIQGSADQSVPKEQSIAMHKKLREAGVSSELILLEGAEHRLRTWKEADAAWPERVVRWIVAAVGD